MNSSAGMQRQRGFRIEIQAMKAHLKTSVRLRICATEEVLLDELAEWCFAEQQNAAH